jgi:AraC family transcriptional regulator
MEHAARELRITDRPILDILLECGFSGAYQFYKRFQDFHRLSPAAYRRQFGGIA